MARNTSYYFWKVMFITYLLTFLSWTQYSIPPNQFSDRMSIILTLFLASVAFLFLFVIGDALPKIPYLTLMDKFLFGNFLALFIIGCENAIVNHITIKYSYVNVEEIDLSIFYVFVICYFLFNVILFGPTIYRKYIIKLKQTHTHHIQYEDSDDYDFILDKED